MINDKLRKIFANFKIFLLAIFYIFGGLLSLQIVLKLFRFEPDAAHSIILWNNINLYGLNWVQNWSFTQDNWLFSLFPINFLFFLIFGAKPIIAILIGWGIFISSIIISGLIALELESKKSLYIVVFILLFMGLYSHASGFVSYATSHNITNLFGLISILLYVKFIKLRKLYLIFIVFLFQILSGLSDPWMIGSYTLPIILASFVLFLKSNTSKEKQEYFLLFSTMIISIIIVKIMFNFFEFLPDTPFIIGSWSIINSNGVFLIRDLGALFNLLPGNDSNFFVSSFVSLFFVFILSVASLYIAINRGLSKNVFAFLIFAFFSIGGILLAFLITDVQANTYSGRFLINIIYLVVISITISIIHNWHYISTLMKVFSIVITFLFVSSGIISNLQIIDKIRFTVDTESSDNFINFLVENNLTYGYGPYWGSLANSTTIASNYKVIIRPVTFNIQSGYMQHDGRAQTSTRWYNETDYPAKQEKFFVIIKNDGEECANTELCIEGVKDQFGKPLDILNYNDSTILVWNHPLINWINLEHLDNNILSKTIPFNSSAVVFTGWSYAEAQHMWSLGNSSSIILKVANLKDAQGVLKLHIGTLGQQEIKLTINDHYIGSQIQASWDNNMIVKFDKNFLIEDGINTIKFEFPNAHKASNEDQRVLAMALKSFSIE